MADEIIELPTIVVTAPSGVVREFPPIEEVITNVGYWEVFTYSHENGYKIGVNLLDKEGEVIFEGDYNDNEYIELRKAHSELGLPPLGSVGNSYINGAVQSKDGNTIGKIQNQSPKKNISASDANPIVKSETDEESQFWTETLDNVQLGVDIIRLIPGVNIIADGANALIYTARGDYTNAALSAAAMVPFAGWGLKAQSSSLKLKKQL